MSDVKKVKRMKLIVSVNDLKQMIKTIKEDRKDDYNGIATTGFFEIRQNEHDKNLYAVDRTWLQFHGDE